MNARQLLADAARAAIGQVADPELHRSLGELQMVRDVSADVVSAASAVDDVTEVTVEFETMTGAQRSAIPMAAPTGTSPARAVYAVASGKGGVGKSSVGVPVVVAEPDSPSAVALRATAASLRPVRRGLAGRSLDLVPVAR